MRRGFSIKRKLSDINIIKLEKAKKMNPNPYNKTITEFFISKYHRINLTPNDPNIYEPTMTEMLLASIKLIIEKFENIKTDKVTIIIFVIKIYEVILFIFVIKKRYFDLDKSSLLSFSTNFCKYNNPKIVTKVIKMNVEIPSGDFIGS
jgi:hypothetical protein